MSTRRPSAITPRSLLLGVLLSVALGWGAPYVMHVLHASYLALDFSCPGATALMLLCVAVMNPLLGRIRPAWRFESGELLVVFAMLLMASSVVEMGLSSQILPIIATPAYYATPENNWLVLFRDRLPTGVIIHDVDAATRFFEGAPGARIDWRVWAPALVVWAPLLAALYAVMMASMVIFRRQWDDRERLAYPLTQVPLALVDTEQRLLRNGTFWIGFLVPVFFASLKGLHHYFPVVPPFELARTVPLPGAGVPIIFRLSFPMLGFFFLVNLDAAFSLWLFNRLFWIGEVVMLKLGLEFTVNVGAFGTPFALYKFLGWGAMLALVAGVTAMARDHLGDVIGKAFGKRPEVVDTDEAMSYRAAVWTVIVGLLVMSFWLQWSGLSYGIAWYYLAMAFLFFLGLTRVVVESGLAEAVTPLIAPGAVVGTFGSGVLGARGHAALALTYVYSSDIRTYPMASTATSLKLFHEGGLRGRGLFWVMCLGLVVGAVSSLWATLAMAYRFGGATMNSWFFVNGPQSSFNWLGGLLQKPETISGLGLTITAFGAVVMAALMIARQRFWWWPLHPVGWAIGSVWIMNQLWFTCLLAWALKYCIVKYGGLKYYRRARPVALGFILGQFTANLVWAVIDALAGGNGNAIFWI